MPSSLTRLAQQRKDSPALTTSSLTFRCEPPAIFQSFLSHAAEPWGISRLVSA